jgi:hypothetical protein
MVCFGVAKTRRRIGSKADNGMFAIVASNPV